jgi:excisionase family DNA binding protein
VIEKVLLRAEEVSRILDISCSKTYALLAAGSLPCLRIGKSVRVPEDGLRAWIAAHTISPKDGSERWAS